MNIPEPLAEVSLATTGGTASSENTGDDSSLVPTKKNFVVLVEDDLAAIGLKISDDVRAPYCILSENTTFHHIQKLIETLIDIIRTKKPRTIVVVHGTDTMEKVVSILDNDGLISFLKVSDPPLADVLETLWTLMEENGTRIIFTGSNTTDEAEIKANIVGACDIENRRDISQGAYIFFADSLVEGKCAVKDIYDGSKTRYIEYNDPGYRARRKAKLEEESALMAKLDEFFRVPKPSAKPRQPTPTRGRLTVAEENAAIRNIRRFHDKPPTTGSPAHMYDATILRDHHNELRTETVRDGVKAVLLVLFHGGTANTDTEHSPELSVEKLVMDIRAEARAAGRDVVFFGVTENYEPVTLDAYETSVRLRKAGVVPLYNTPKLTAGHKLGLIAGRCRTPEEIVQVMLMNCVGEIDETLINPTHKEELRASYR